jgi:hypothetical protein
MPNQKALELTKQLSILGRQASGGWLQVDNFLLFALI